MTREEAIEILEGLAVPIHAEPAFDMAIEALKAQADLQPTCDKLATDTISRQEAIDAVDDIESEVADGDGFQYAKWREYFCDMPSAQPEPSEITDEQAIMHLQSTGWMQNHDREMYESGLRERLADDSDSYDALLPSAQPELTQNLHNACTDLISRQEVIKLLDEAWVDGHEYQGWLHDEVNRLPSAQPEPHYDEWCTDCKEYDHERYCCPRWNRVIRETLKGAQPEIIRCKDCRWNDGVAYCEMHFRDVKGDDFCSWAERGTDGR